MSRYVFVGPTLRHDEIAAVSDAVCLPPVAQGDVYRVAQRRPAAIGIIDGFFSGAPSVWHKEILWALSQGISVFGSASMGALRAAELQGFGMRGVGRIFEAFRDGVLEDDDEVAVVHGPAETGFVPVSEPMVNIRATLAEAGRQGVLSEATRRALEAHAKSLFYPHRSWPALLAGARALGAAEDELAALQYWLPGGRVDQKREDALAMLVAMQEMSAQPDPHPPSFRFEWTHYWDGMFARGRVDTAGPGEPPSAVSERSIIEELRLEGDEAYGRAKSGALLRLLASMEARRHAIEPSPEAKRAILGGIRAALGLFTRAELESWLARNSLDPASLERLIDEQSRLEALAKTISLDGPLLDEMRLAGAYVRLAQRARQKQKAIAAHDLTAPPAENMAMLRLWFFEQRLGRAMPDDIETYSHELGFANLADFDSALRREWIYLHWQSQKTNTSV